MTVYVRCPDCHGYSADPLWGDDCQLCDNAGSLSEDRLKEKLGEAESGEILDLYYRRGEFEGIKPPPISPFVKGFDA